MTGDIAHPSDVVARDLNRWLERDKHLAQASPDAGTRPIRTICSGVE